MSISIVIVEDDIHYNHALKKIIDHAPDMVCLAQCFGGRDALRELKRLKPDVALVDINMKDMSGIEVLEALRDLSLPTQYLMCTYFEDDTNIVKALKAGADGYLLKGESMDKIIASVREIHLGGVPMSSSVAKKILQQFSTRENAATLGLLTKTEKDVILLVSEGLAYKEIAEQKFISLLTVRKHVANIYKKLGVTNKVEAINKLRDG